MKLTRVGPDWFNTNPYYPPHAENGAATAEELYLLVGQICSAWEVLEHKLMILLTVVAGFSSTEQAVAAPFRAAFRSVLSATGKRDVIRLVAETSMEGRPELKDVNRLLDLLQRLTSLRNKAVHATVNRHQSIDPDLAWFVAPSASSKLYGLKDKPYSIAYRFNGEHLRQIHRLILRFDGIVGQQYTELASIHHVELHGPLPHG